MDEFKPDDVNSMASAEGDTSGEGSSPSGEGAQTVPLTRFQEVYTKKQELEKELSALKTSKPSNEISEEEKKLEDQMKRINERQDREKKTAKDEEQKQFNGNVDDVLSVYSDVDRSDFLKFIENNSDRYGITSVKGAMSIYRDINKMAQETEEQVKQRMSSKPALPRNEGMPNFNPKYDDSNKTIEQIAEEAAREAAARIK